MRLDGRGFFKVLRYDFVNEFRVKIKMREGDYWLRDILALDVDLIFLSNLINLGGWKAGNLVMLVIEIPFEFFVLDLRVVNRR